MGTKLDNQPAFEEIVSLIEKHAADLTRGSELELYEKLKENILLRMAKIYKEMDDQGQNWSD